MNAPRLADSGDALPLPPLDDDGDAPPRADDADDGLADLDEAGTGDGGLAIDDGAVGTGENEGEDAALDEASWFDADAREGLEGDDDEDDEVTAPAERGWLEGSHEPLDRGEEVSADELVPELPRDRDDGGAEGTDEDPAAVLEPLPAAPELRADDAREAVELEPAAIDLGEPGRDASGHAGDAAAAALDARWPSFVAQRWVLEVAPPRAMLDFSAHAVAQLDDAAPRDAVAAIVLGAEAGTVFALWDAASSTTAFVHASAEGTRRVAQRRFDADALDELEASALSDEGTAATLATAGRVRAMRCLADDRGAVVVAITDAATLTLRLPARVLASMR